MYSDMPPKRKNPKDVWAGRRKEEGHFKIREENERRKGPVSEVDYKAHKVRTTRRMDFPEGKTHHTKNRRKLNEQGDYL